MRASARAATAAAKTTQRRRRPRLLRTSWRWSTRPIPRARPRARRSNAAAPSRLWPAVRRSAGRGHTWRIGMRCTARSCLRETGTGAGTGVRGRPRRTWRQAAVPSRTTRGHPTRRSPPRRPIRWRARTWRYLTATTARARPSTRPRTCTKRSRRMTRWRARGLRRWPRASSGRPSGEPLARARHCNRDCRCPRCRCVRTAPW